MSLDTSRASDARRSSAFVPQWGHASATGRRPSNQDSYACDPATGLWLVADGMGGHQGGEVAAAVAAQTIVTEVRLQRRLGAAVRCAHTALRDLHPGGGPAMGSTVVAALFDGPEFELAWVGDSRAYLWDGELKPLTRDHSVVQELLDAGAITSDEARSHPSRTVITQALGATSGTSVEVGRERGRLPPGGWLVLCSDGLNAEVADEDIGVALEDATSAQDAAERLVELALEAGGSDNVTVLVLGRDEPAPGDCEELPDLGETNSMDALEDLERSPSPARPLVYGLIIGLALALTVLLARLALS
jgi:protein phosphatase